MSVPQHRDSGVRPVGPEFSEPLTLRDHVELILARRRLVGAVVLLATVLAIGVAALKPRTYTSRAAFMPQGETSAGGLSLLAAQFGVGGASVGGDSPQLYVELMTRQSTMRQLAGSRYPAVGETYPSLVPYYDVDAETPGARLDRAVRKLRKDLAVQANLKTGIVTLEVVMKDPELSRAVAARAIALVNAFNLDQRRSKAAAERDFVQDRLSQALVELRAAENRQARFHEANAVVSSPRLRLEAERLARDVSTRQAVYTTLSQAYEQARIDAVRDTPVLTIIEEPTVPSEPDSRGLGRALVFGLFGGLALGLLLAYWAAMWHATPSSAVRSP